MVHHSNHVDEFVMKQTFSKPASSYELAVQTSELVKALVEEPDWNTAKELIEKLRETCRKLETDVPNLFVVHNTLKHILKLVREEYLSASKTEEGECQPESLHKLIINRENSDYGKNVTDLRERVFEIIEELLLEFEVACEEISKQAIEHIHANEIIMTIGHSRTVEKFLKFAAKNRKFQVIVAESAPSYSGHKLAANLAGSKISTTVITDDAIFAMMARVNKVIIGTSAILADGGLNAISGSRTVAMAAKHYSVPLIVLGAVYKLTPKFIPTGDQLASSLLSSPDPVLRDLEGKTKGKISCVNPLLEFVPSNLVTLFISNLSGYSPSYVYRQMAELYHRDDRQLEAS